MKTNRQTGFTLIEVLIAATILFAVIGVVSQTYRSAIISSEKATRSVALLGITPLLLDTIQFRLKQADVNQTVTDEGIIDGFQFNWTAKVIKAASPAQRFSPEDGDLVTYDKKFFLWEIVLTVKQGDYNQTFEFESLAWGTQ